MARTNKVGTHGTQLAGIQIPHYRIRPEFIWTAESTFTQAGPFPGIPVPQSTATDLVLMATGTQIADDSLDIETQRGGHPRPEGAQFIYRHDETGDRFGWDPPIAWASSEFIVFQPPVATELINANHMATTEDDFAVLATTHQDVGTLVMKIRIRRRDPATDLWTEIAAAPLFTSQAFALAADVQIAHACVVPTPGNRLLLYHWVTDPVQLTAQIQAQQSVDNGATWQVFSSRCLPNPIDISGGGSGGGIPGFDLGKIRAVVNGGEVLLLTEVTFHNTSLSEIHQVNQYSSDDDGSTFTEVFVGDGSGDPGAAPDVVVSEGHYIMGYLTGATSPSFKRFSTATDPWTDAATITPPALTATLGWSTSITNLQGEFAMARDTDGVLYAYGLYTSGTAPDDAGLIVYSVDAGRTWAYIESDSGTSTELVARWHPDVHGAAASASLITATPQRGRVIVALDGLDPTVALDPSLVAVYLGGYTQLNMPTFGRSDRIRSRVAWEGGYIPLALPADYGFTAAGVASVEAVITPGFLDLHTTAGNLRTYTRTDATTIAQGYLQAATWSTQTGITSEIGARYDDGGTTHYEVRVERSTTTITVRDVVGAADVATAAVTGTVEVEVFMATANGKVSVWYRTFDNGEARSWISIVQNGTLVAGAGSTDQHQWGHLTAGAASSEWRNYRFASGDRTGLQMEDGFTNPDDLYGRTHAVLPQWVDGGTRVGVVSGPANAIDEHRIPTRYEFPIDYVTQHVKASPAVRYRALNTALMRVAWQLSTIAAEDTAQLSDLLGITYVGGNLRSFEVEARFSGSWNSLGVVDCFEIVSWRRSGDAVTPKISGATQSGAHHYIELDELVGGYFEFPTGDVRKIIHNTEGNWLDNNTAEDRLTPRIVLEGVDGGEGVTGTNNGRIWFPRVQALLYIGSLSAGFDKWEGLRIVVDPGANPTPPEGFWEFKMSIGPVKVWGTRTSRGWARVIEDNTEMAERRDGQRKTRANSKPRRSASLIFSDALDIRTALGSDSPDFIQGSSSGFSRPHAHFRDPPLLARAIYDHLDGRDNLVTLLPFIPQGPPDLIVHRFQRQRGALFGRIVTPIRVNHVQGDDENSEYVRVAEIVVEAEL